MNKTYKKISAVLLAAGMLTASACNKEEPAPTAPPTVASSFATTSETPDASAAESSAPASSVALAPVIASSGQLDAIFKAKTTWYAEGDTEMKYAVTDLDMNGRYEITAAKKDHFAMYEVNADASGVEKVITPFEDGSTGPYIEEEYKLRVNKEGAYVYVARETDDSASELTIYYYLVSLSNGKLTSEMLATEIHEGDGVRYGDDEFNITKEEFKQKTDKGLPAVEYIQKVSWGDASAVAGMNDGKALEAICFKLYK